MVIDGNRLLYDLYQKMVDRAIKVSVLEGDFASLSAIGFPLPLHSASIRPAEAQRGNVDSKVHQWWFLC